MPTGNIFRTSYNGYQTSSKTTGAQEAHQEVHPTSVRPLQETEGKSYHEIDVWNSVSSSRNNIKYLNLPSKTGKFFVLTYTGFRS